MTQVQKIYQYEEASVQASEQNRFETCEKIVDDLIEKGLPKTYSPDTFINKISKTYGINLSEARTCLKLAIKELEKNSENKKDNSEKLYAQSGYFYPTGYNTLETPKAKNDGMDSLSSLGSYNKLMFLR